MLIFRVVIYYYGGVAYKKKRIQILNCEKSLNISKGTPSLLPSAAHAATSPPDQQLLRLP